MHEFCRIHYASLCKAYGIPYRLLTVYRYTQIGNTPQFQIYKGKRIVGDYCGCCAYDAKAEAISKHAPESESGLHVWSALLV